MSVTTVPIHPLRKGSVLKLWLGLALLSLAGAALAWAGTSGVQVSTTESGLRYQVVEEGDGPPITPADLVQLHYVGRTEDGNEFDSSVSRGQPMVTGVTGIIPGFAEGLQLMKGGGRYRLWIPPHLGYGGRVPPGAPFGPNDTLVFDIEILEVAQGMAAMQQLMGPGGPGAPPGAEGAAPPPGAEGAPGSDGATPSEGSSGRGRGGR